MGRGVARSVGSLGRWVGGGFKVGRVWVWFLPPFLLFFLVWSGDRAALGCHRGVSVSVWGVGSFSGDDQKKCLGEVRPAMQSPEAGGLLFWRSLFFGGVFAPKASTILQRTFLDLFFRHLPTLHEGHESVAPRTTAFVSCPTTTQCCPGRSSAPPTGHWPGATKLTRRAFCWMSLVVGVGLWNSFPSNWN